MRNAFWSVDKDQPLWAVMSLESIVDNVRAPWRFVSMLLALFAAVAVTIASAAGVACAVLGARFISSLLVGVASTDAASLAGASAVLILIALLACWVPARRASRVDPLIALRYE